MKHFNVLITLLACASGAIIEVTEGCIEVPYAEYTMPDCVCHHSCGLCGYMISPPPDGPNHCATCKDPTKVI